MDLLKHVGEFLLYFAAGFTTDYLVVKYYLYLLNRQRVKTSILSMVIDYYGFFLAAMLVPSKNYIMAAAVALGIGAGTYIAMGKK